MTKDTAKTTTDINIAEETSKFGIRVMLSMSVVIGIWGAACLIGGLASEGVVGLAKGFLTANGL